MSKSIGTLAVDLLPPATLAAVVAFWYFAPAAWVANPWTLLMVSCTYTAWVLLLELVFERHAGWRTNRQEFVTDLFYFVFINTVIAQFVLLLADEPLRALKQSWGISTPWAMEMPFLVQVALFVVVWELGQYIIHRLMHDYEPFWLTHAPHHHITQLNAMKGAVGNPIELFLVSIGVVALFDLPANAMLCGYSFTGVISTFNHANVRSNPPFFYSFFFTTIKHHSYHHSVGYENTRCNYGNNLILLDRIFGTYKEGEGILVGQDDRRRLSIREQWLFPFRPLIDWAQGKKGETSAAGN